VLTPQSTGINRLNRTDKDRLLELTGTFPWQPSPTASLTSAVLDQLAVEPEQGITVKAVAEKPYLLKLIDTPGCLDFTTEVLCSSLVDATQGVQVQTLAVLQTARRRKFQIYHWLNLKKWHFKLGYYLAIIIPIMIPLKLVINLAMVYKIYWTLWSLNYPHLCIANPHQPLRAIVFDFWFNYVQGVVSLVSLADGRIQKGITFPPLW
ncbi:hypothetical protein MJO28_014552, partial [Puccinia striiformis f. sp. tritici]